MKRESSPPEQAWQNGEEPPPFGGSWGRLYAAVLGWLALLILLFYWFSRRFAP
ncbi:MAG: hypothetical protein ACUVXB_11485 [Bryobacteraceae bacterium]